MERINTLNREIDKFGPGKDGFRSAVPGVSEPTYLSAEWCNAVQESLMRIQERAGLDPSADLDLVGFAVQKMAELASDSGIDRLLSGQRIRQCSDAVVIIDGDSLSSPNIGGNDWPTLVTSMSAFRGHINLVRKSVPGETMEQRLAAFDTDIAPNIASAVAAGRKVFLSIFAGANSYVQVGYAAATFIAAWDEYIAKARAAAASNPDLLEIIGWTVMRRVDGVANEPIRTAMNTHIRRNSYKLDHLIQPDVFLPDPFDNTIFAEGIHPGGELGYFRMARAVNDALVSGGSHRGDNPIAQPTRPLDPYGVPYADYGAGLRTTSLLQVRSGAGGNAEPSGLIAILNSELDRVAVRLDSGYGLPTEPIHALGSGSFAVAWAARADSFVGRPGIVGGTGPGGLTIGHNVDGTLSVSKAGVVDVGNSTVPCTADAWYIGVYSRDAGTGKGTFWINNKISGVIDDTNNYNGGIASVGSRDGNGVNSLVGSIARVTILPAALTPGQVENITAALGLIPPDLVPSTSFCMEDADLNVGARVRDRSPVANHLMLRPQSRIVNSRVAISGAELNEMERAGLQFAGGFATLTPSIPPLGAGDITVVFFLRPDLAAFTGSSGIIGGNGPGGFQLSLTAGAALKITKTGVADIGQSSVMLLAAQPYMVAYRRTAGVGQFFVNREYAGTFADATDYTSTSPVIGAKTSIGEAPLYGMLSRVAVIPRSLGQAELFALFDRALRLTPSQRAEALFALDDGSRYTGSPVKDRSPGARHASWTSGVELVFGRVA